MVLGNESSTRPNHVRPTDRLAVGAGPERDDRVLAVQHRSAAVAPHRLRADHRALLLALVSHLMPSDGGTLMQPEIVVRYIDYLIANEGGGGDVPLTLGEAYGEGCRLVESHALRVYGRRVQRLTAVERDRLVWDMLECSMDGFDRFSPAWFFNTLRRHIADAMQVGTISTN